MTVSFDTQKVGELIKAHMQQGCKIHFHHYTWKPIATMGVVETVLHCGEMTMIVVSGMKYRIDWYKYSAEYFSGRSAVLELKYVGDIDGMLMIGSKEISALQILPKK